MFHNLGFFVAFNIKDAKKKQQQKQKRKKKKVLIAIN